MSTPRRHHFVPAFYLRQWIDAAGDVIEHSIKYGKHISKPVGPDGTGFEFDLYAFERLPPELRQHLEARFFNYTDGLASRALNMHLGIETPDWGSVYRSAWSRFLLGMLTRHPDTMEELRNGAEATWKESGNGRLQEEYDKHRGDDDPLTLAEFQAKMDPDIDEKMKLNLLISVFDHQELGRHVNNMHWSVLDLSKSIHRLLTSDRPVQLFNLSQSDGAVCIPISPTKLFIAVNDKRTLKQIISKPAKDFVISSNRFVVSRTRRYVWSQDLQQLNFIRKYMSTSMETLPLFPSVSRLNRPPLSQL
jgi:hypothetical protein